MSVGKLLRTSLPFANVVASGIATASVSVGRTIEAIYLIMGGTTFTSAHVSMVKIKANGKAIFEATGAQLDKIAKFQGLAYPATMLPILFSELKGRDFLDQMAGSLDTSVGIANLTIEVTIAGASAPTLVASVIESQPQPGQYSPIMAKVLRYPFSVSAGGKLSVALPFGANNGAIVKRLHIEHGVASNVTAVDIKENGVIVHESARGVNDAHNQLFGRTNQTNTYTVDFMVDNNLRNCMDTRGDRSLELLPTFGAADSGFVIVEYLDVLGNL